MPKPAIIRTIEAAAGCTLTEQLDLSKLKKYDFPKTYALDANGNVIGLNLRGVGLKTFDFWAELVHLQVLNLSENKLTEISFPAGLKTLAFVNLSENPELRSAVFVEGLPKLEELRLSECKLARLDLPPGFLALDTLHAGRNALEEMVFQGDCPAVQHLYLGSNQLKSLKLPRAEKRLQWIELAENPMESPPKEIVEQGSAAILNWFAANKKALNEVKVLIIGDAEAGKTSLLRRLKNDEFNPKEPQTDGIIIETFDFDRMPTFAGQQKLHGIRAYCWDFGGQEILGSTHQFFMTNRSVYVLLLEARSDKDTEQQVRQWLSQIKRQGGNSPVLIVVNKIEVNRSFGVDTYKLRQEFPQIKDSIKISCALPENIKELRDLLEKHIPEAELFNTQIDERWLEIKEDLQTITRKNHYIAHKEFLEICRKHGLTDTIEQSQAITFLNDLGIVLHFEHLNLQEYYVLDPYWVTYGVYRIITSPTAQQQKGSIQITQLDFIVNKEHRKDGEYRASTRATHEYGPNELRYLADIMAEFKLSFYTNQHQTILIPDLLDYKTPVEESKAFDRATNKLSLVYDYGKDLPAHTFSRFMVERHAEIEYPWRTGVILTCASSMQARAMVIRVEKQIRIIVTGDHRDKRDYLAVLRYTLDQINLDQKVNPSIKIPLPGYENQFVVLDELLRREKSGETEYIHYAIEEQPKFEIKKLLEGIESKEAVHQRAQTIIHNYYGEGGFGDKTTVPKPSQPEEEIKKILFLFSSPTDKNALDFGRDLKNIQSAHRSSIKRDEYAEPIIRPSVPAAKFTRTVLADKPAILHLTMHASKSEGLYFEDQNGEVQAISPDKLVAYFEIITEEYRPYLCVLSACNTIGHARALQPFCDYVVGMQDFFPDDAAKIYSEAFYEHLFDGNKVATAHKAALQALKEAGLSFKNQEFPVHEIPVLLTKA